MCRNFNIFLNAVKIEDLFFTGDGEGYQIQPAATIQTRLRERIEQTHLIAEDCSKKSTKAGYDAAGMALGYVPLAPVIERLESLRQGNGHLSAGQVAEIADDIQAELKNRVRVARDGGDLLKTWDGLVNRLHLSDTEFITNWETHVRQASQGDMYSESNAHPHFEKLSRTRIRIYQASADHTLTYTEQERVWGESLFYDTHNGDINDAGRYKRFLNAEGYEFFSNSDSCVEPALKRFLYEHIMAGSLSGGLHALAYIDPDYQDGETVSADYAGHIGDYALSEAYAHQSFTVSKQGKHIHFVQGGEKVATFLQRGFLRDDSHTSAEAKIAELVALAEAMRGAHPVTIAAGVAARIFEYSLPGNKFTFQSYTPVGAAEAGYIGGGTYTMTRGGTGRGGEEGGELIFYLPKPYDAKNYGRAAFLSASEENALKEQVVLLDGQALKRGEIALAQPRVQKIGFLTDVRATAYITEGFAPIYDVLPGELVEVTAEGRVTLYDIYTGAVIPLISMEEAGNQAGRHERLAPLKVFKIDYFNEAGDSIPCPYNKYGEEIIVIQPLALRLNTEKLFTTDAGGSVRLRIGAEGIGLTMGTEDETERRERIRALRHMITGGAGTSNLINTIAANIARKLNLHSLPVSNFDGFTGSDTIPMYVSRETLFMANSNSGGTSDTIKLTHEMSGLPAVIKRLEHEISHRDSRLPEVAALQAQLDSLHQLVESGTPFDRWPSEAQAVIKARTPYVYVVTNIEASALGNIGRGVDTFITTPAGAGITNLPEEECVGSTFAAIASYQWQVALHTYIGEVRGDISPAYASRIYAQLAQLPDVTEQIVSDKALQAEIRLMSEELVGGNFDFVYTGYVDGVPEEQAHKAAEMIQEMFAGWNFFQFQHGKYAHMKRRTRYTLGSILAHDAPPPSWSFFNARALKSPREIGPRVATSFLIAHISDRERLANIPDYAPDYIFTYPADSIPLYPAQSIIISQLISYLWGLRKKEISELINRWNTPFVEALLNLPQAARAFPAEKRATLQSHAGQVLGEFLDTAANSPCFDRMEGRRRAALLNMLSLLAGEDAPTHQAQYHTSGLLGGNLTTFTLTESRQPAAALDDAAFLSVLKDVALELSNTEQAKELANHFLVDADGRTMLHKVHASRPQGRTRSVYEYDYLVEYEGLGTFYDVEPVHPPKIAKAKKGWL